MFWTFFLLFESRDVKQRHKKLLFIVLHEVEIKGGKTIYIIGNDRKSLLSVITYAVNKNFTGT